MKLTCLLPLALFATPTTIDGFAIHCRMAVNHFGCLHAKTGSLDCIQKVMRIAHDPDADPVERFEAQRVESCFLGELGDWLHRQD